MKTSLERIIPRRQPSSPRVEPVDVGSEPWWSRPGLLAVSVLAAALVLWALTKNGYANAWYAQGAMAASRSWRSWLENSADLSNLMSLDKGPLPDWMMGLSGRILGFGSFSLLLPDALCGIAGVVVLHDAVRRTLGHRAALLAALMLAVSPVSVMMDRYDNPEALLTFLMIASAWALVRALESGRLRHMLLCGLCVGLAFETKMLVAYLIVPGLAVAFVVAGRGGWRRRLGHLSAGGAVMVLVSFAWFAAMMLIPAGQRPYVSDTTDNSWFTLIFGFNGVSRLSGAGTSNGPSFVHGLTLLFTGAEVGGQIGWLLPLALVGLLVGLWITRHRVRQDRGRAAYLLFGLWALAGYVVFSFSRGIFHGYYTAAMAPAIAVLAAGGVVNLVERARVGRGWTVAAVVALAATAALSFLLLDDTSSFVPWLRWVILAAAAVSIVVLTGLKRRPASSPGGPWRSMSGLALGATMVALLAGPAAYSVATLGRAQQSVIPAAGPGPNADDFPVNRALVTYLTAHRQGTRYLFAAGGARAAAPVALATRAAVVTIGGFDGTSPAPTVNQLTSLVASGQLRYVMPGDTASDLTMRRWIASRCKEVTILGGPVQTMSRRQARAIARLRNGAKLLRTIRAGLRAEDAVYRCTPRANPVSTVDSR